jgi:hypothetical protein
MRYAIYWGLAFYLGAAALLTLASTRLKKDWVE